MKGNFYVMRCSAAVTCHVKVILNFKNWRLFIRSWSNKVWSNIGIFQLLKSLFLSFINSLRFNGYKELKIYYISLWKSCIFFLVLFLLCCKTGEFVLSRTKKSESWCWIQCIKNVYLGISFAVISLLRIEICSK